MSFRRDTKEIRNWARTVFDEVGRYDIPQIKGVTEVPPQDFIGFNYAKTSDRTGKTCHFYLDDYQFNRVWDRPEQSIELLKGFDYVLSPDFSLYADYPKAVQIYNHYRKHWCAVYWQSEGIQVIPTISWSDPESYEWCFDGEPRNSVVSVSAIGIMRILNRARVGYLIVTKSALVADDLYLRIMDKDLAHIQITVTTTDDKLCGTYEKASPPSERIKAIEKLQDAGFDVQVRLSPFIPEYIDFEKLNAIECDKILVEFLRVNHWIEKWFPIDYSEYTVEHGGYRKLPLEKKIELLKNVTGFEQVSVCEDEDRAYAYWRDHFNANQNDCCNLRGAKNGNCGKEH